MIRTWNEQQEKREKLKKQLRDSQYIKLEIKGKIHMYQELIESVYGPKAAVNSGMPHGTDISDPTYQAYKRIQKTEEQIALLQEELDKEILTIDNILNMKDSNNQLVLTGEEKAILTWKYLNNIRWENMEDYVNYSTSQAQRIHNRAIDKLIKANEIQNS